MRWALAPVLVVLLALPALAAPDGYRAWKKGHRALARQEAEYWDAFRRRLDAVYAGWIELRRLWRGDPENYREEVDDLSELRELYQEYVDIQAAAAEIDLELARSGDERAGKLLLDAFLDVAKTIDRLEAELAEGRPVRFEYYYDQEPSIRRHALAARERGLVEALAAVPGAVDLLVSDAWDKATKGDKTRSLVRRVAVLDALGRTGDDAALAFLERMLRAEEPGVRIVAAENLVPLRRDRPEVLSPLLDDPAPAVRRALLDAIRALGAGEKTWIPAVMGAYLDGPPGLVRARAYRTLVVLTGQRLPDDEEAWRTWYGANAEAISAGSWKPPPPAEGDEEETPRPPLRAVARTMFYGVGVPSRNLVFVVDGTEDVSLPASRDVQKGKSRHHWRTTKGWRELFPDHRTVLLEQLEATLNALPESALFGVVLLSGSTPARVPVMGDRHLLQPSKRTIKSVLKLVEKALPQGILSCEEGLRRAFALSRTDPLENPEPGAEHADTVFLLSAGWNVGRWGIPEALVDAFARENRLRRLEVHTLRILDEKEEAERLLKGVAEASGGTYTWL